MNKERRQFVVKGLRGCALAAISVLAGRELLKRRRLLREGTCINKSICCNCRGFEDCRLPAALSAKAKRGRK